MRFIILTMVLLAGGCAESFERLMAYPQTESGLETAAAVDAAKPLPQRDAGSLLFDAALAVCGVLGGAGALKAGAAISIAKQSYTALHEIIAGNEQFKRDCPEAKESFKLAQSEQSTQTKQIVSRIKADT
ncbi:MAG: hypothetical protein AB7F23_08875 [Phycisphaerae bacterium]